MALIGWLPAPAARLGLLMVSIAAWLVGAGAATCGDLIDPPVFASKNGLLDIVMMARPQLVPSITYVPPDGTGALHPTGWVYAICQSAAAVGGLCPDGHATASNYGGIRLALQKGDALKIHLVNQLPALNPLKVLHILAADGLALNPTNLHTHGMLVPARPATLRDPTFGDYVFVDIFNPANGTPAPQPPRSPHQHGSVIVGPVDYRIDLPANHPSGSFWFHPHVHGLALNQVSSGMAGIITVGKVGDYAYTDVGHAPFPESSTRYLVLKDMQVLAAGNLYFGNNLVSVADGEVLSQEASPFCNQYPLDGSDLRLGSCPGVDETAVEKNDYTGGVWYFTVNGQQFPTIRVREPDGEIWRLTNASGSVTYDLQLLDDATQNPIVMQLVSVDGVSINIPPETSADTLVQVAGARFKVVPCQNTTTAALTSKPVCVSQFAMMPSSRAEVWVAYRNAAGQLVRPPAGASATFQQMGITTGPVGDPWPQINLAKVLFTASSSSGQVRSALDVDGDAVAAAGVAPPGSIFSQPIANATEVQLPPGCATLAPGHHRRIFFGQVLLIRTDGTGPDVDWAGANPFGLGYEEVDQNGNVVAGTQVPVTEFVATQTTVCLPLGPGQTPVQETWELVNLATENHNFHIHQTRFAEFTSAAVPNGGNSSAGIMEDNLPLPVATTNDQTVFTYQGGYCSIDQWRSGDCVSPPVLVNITFTQLGTFVYHCHILAHEDGGMMARIQVVPAPQPLDVTSPTMISPTTVPSPTVSAPTVSPPTVSPSEAQGLVRP